MTDLDLKLKQAEENLLKMGPLEVTVNDKPFTNELPLEKVIIEIANFGRIGIYDSNPNHKYYVSTEPNGQICKNKYRSVGDIFRMLYKHYNLSLKDLLFHIYDLDNKGELSFFFCPDIKKRVLCKYHQVGNAYTGRRDEDDLGFEEYHLKQIYNEKINGL